MNREILPYNNKLLNRAKEFRKNMTNTEKVLWSKVRGKQISNIKFDRQVIVDNFIIDFYSKELKLAIEIDGSIHDSRKEYDEEREIILKSKGIMFLRFSNNQVLQQLNDVINIITKKVQLLSTK